MIELFHDTCRECSKITTRKYSTSFSSAIYLLHKDLRHHIYNIYGFVRFADEIVDTFHGFDKSSLLERFRQETREAVDRGLSLNPILHSFQATVKECNISYDLIEAFFVSMEMDLGKRVYDQNEYETYIYGSAETVGLMCLSVFCEGNPDLYRKLTPAARSLGAAFQKVNFLRDVQNDYELLNRTYFPGVDFEKFDSSVKGTIEDTIEKDFADAYQGILQLPYKARFGVYVAYKYYYSLFKKIKDTEANYIMQQRVRIPNIGKFMIVMRAGIRNQLNMI